jgi:hypothetical protein
VALALIVQPAFAQRLMVPATGQEGLQFVHSTKPAAKKAKAGKAAPKKAKPAAGKTAAPAA